MRLVEALLLLSLSRRIPKTWFGFQFGYSYVLHSLYNVMRLRESRNKFLESVKKRSCNKRGEERRGVGGCCRKWSLTDWKRSIFWKKQSFTALGQLQYSEECGEYKFHTSVVPAEIRQI